MSTTVRVGYEQFEEMIRRGEFDESDEFVELLDGEVVSTPIPGPFEEHLRWQLTEWSYRSLPNEGARIRSKGSFGMPAHDSVAVPALLWLRRLDYSQRRPLPEDVYLIIEVSDATLSRDRNLKASLYAQAGIADYWIVNVAARTLEIRRAPRGAEYASIEVLRPGDEARPLAFPDIALPVSRLFPD